MLHPTFGKSDSCDEEGNNAESSIQLFSHYVERLKAQKDHQQIQENPYKNMVSSKRMLNITFTPSLKFTKVEEKIMNIIEIRDEDESEDSKKEEKPRLQKLL